MAKRRVVKKRIARRNNKKSNTKTHTKNDTKNDTQDKLKAVATGNMNKLEYEMALTDPRFRAAMVGFNNPNLNNTPNYKRYEQEGKNNELVRQLGFQEDMAKLKQTNTKLKDQIKTNKLIHDNEMKQQKLESDNKIQQIQATVAEKDREIKDQQLKYEQEQKINKLKHEKEAQKIQASIAEKDIALKQQQTKYEQDQKIKQLEYEKEIQKIHSEYEPLIQAAQSETNDLRNHLNVLTAQNRTIDEIKRLMSENIRTQIEASSQPIIQQLQSEIQGMRSDIALNKTIYDEIHKQNDLKIQKAQLEQITDPQVRDEYFQKLKDQKLETHRLEQINAHAKAVNKAYSDTENIRSQIIDNCSRVIPNFQIEMIDDPKFKDILEKRQAELNKQIAHLTKQDELAKHTINSQKRLEDKQFEYAESKARLNATSTISDEHIKLIEDTARKKVELEREIKRTHEIENEVEDLVSQSHITTEGMYSRWHKFLENKPRLKEYTDRWNMQHHKNKDTHIEDVPKILKDAARSNEKFLESIESIPEFMNPEAEATIQEFTDIMKQRYGFDPENTRESMKAHEQSLLAQNRQDLKDKLEAQKRAKQNAIFDNMLYTAISAPVTKQKLDTGGSINVYEGGVGTPSSENTIFREIPNENDNPNFGFKATNENITNILGQAGITQKQYLDNIQYALNTEVPDEIPPSPDLRIPDTGDDDNDY